MDFTTVGTQNFANKSTCGAKSRPCPLADWPMPNSSSGCGRSTAKRKWLLGEGREQTRELVDEAGNRIEKAVKNGMDPAAAEKEMKSLSGCRDVALGQVVRYRPVFYGRRGVGKPEGCGRDFQRGSRAVRHATQGDGTPAPRGAAAPAKGMLWTARDLRVRV